MYENDQMQQQYKIKPDITMPLSRVPSIQTQKLSKRDYGIVDKKYQYSNVLQLNKLVHFHNSENATFANRNRITYDHHNVTKIVEE